jgi:hypothetical protein
MASALLVLARGTGDLFDVNARFFFSNNVAVTKGGIVTVGVERVAVRSLLGTVSGNAIPCMLFHLASLYNLSLLDELVNLGKRKRFDIQGIHEIHCGLLIFSGF